MCRNGKKLVGLEFLMRKFKARNRNFQKLIIGRTSNIGSRVGKIKKIKAPIFFKVVSKYLELFHITSRILFINIDSI